MPGLDRTGPFGYGPLTGRGLGPCGRGFARGRGFGWRRFTPVIPAESRDEKVMLKEDLKAIEEEKKLLDQESAEIKKRLKELK